MAHKKKISTKQKLPAKNKVDALKEGGVSPSMGTRTATVQALEVLSSQGVVAALRGQKQGISDLLHNTDRALSIKLAVVYGAGLLVERDEDEWHSLCAAQEWIDHPKVKPKRTDPLRAVLRLAVGFEGKKADSTVHRYYKALSPLFLEKVPADQIPIRILEAGGIEKMRQNSARSIVVNSTPDILQTLHGVTKAAQFRAWITVHPLGGGVANVTIEKLKQPKKK
ncbi:MULTISPECIES: hypothetical protein [Rhizobium]|uniref:hypothetical protein n=1 Tax=Rhizobium TaxID=379 RepID=UPI001030808D|nr:MULTISPECIES: hypothetical protein [Rhizobium]MBY3202025.1 hypothetical protein [Rhizobium laguerreae]TBG66579.1 hypothetical protein ELG74_01190 [Rhizobium leguminosarum]